MFFLYNSSLKSYYCVVIVVFVVAENVLKEEVKKVKEVKSFGI